MTVLPACRAAWREVGGALAAATVAAASAAAQAPDVVVDVELVLAVDVSTSMDAEEHLLQRRGYVEAFRHDALIGAIQSGYVGRIAVTYLEWAGDAAQRQILPWTEIASRADALAFADALEAAPVARARFTSISQALRHAADLLDDNGYAGARRVIDISGDGANNVGGPVTEARDHVASRGVTINGLPIMLKGPSAWYDIDNLDAYYEHCVVTGFLAPVSDIDELAGAIRDKLILEIAAPAAVPAIRRAQFKAPGPDGATSTSNPVTTMAAGPVTGGC